MAKQKRAAAEAAAAYVEPGMVVGLGTGTTVAFLLPALASRHLDIHCVATSPATQSVAREVGLRVQPFDGLDRLDMAIDGADQVDPDGWLVKGGGGAHTREKVVAAAAERFVVIVSSDKQVRRLVAPVPVEVLAFGLDATLRSVPGLRVRGVAPSPDGGVIADYWGPVDDPEALADRLAAVPGVLSHGLFPPAMVAEILVGRPGGVDSLRPRT